MRHLRPLSRAAVAQQLGVHESTVSRATASKYVMLPNGEVIPYAHFFTPSLSVKDIMKEVIEKEGKPLTDSEIVERLKENGYGARTLVQEIVLSVPFRYQPGASPALSMQKETAQ